MLAGPLIAWVATLVAAPVPAAAAPAPAAAAPASPTGPPAPAASVRIEGGRATTLVVTDDVGAPVERAVAGRAYARAVAADSEQRWTEAESLYRDAITEWNAAARRDPSRALELAIAKAERERQRSQLLAARARAAAGNRGPREGMARRLDALDEARLLRGKMMSTRAMSGRISPALYAQARARLEEALRTKDPSPSPPPPHLPPLRTAGDGEIRLLLCATRAAAGELEAARWLRAQVTEAERDDPSHLLARAACAAALGETPAALATLEMVTLHPGRSDRSQLRELYISNDWDRLRGTPRFERLFPR